MSKLLTVTAAAQRVSKLAKLGVKASIIPSSEGKFRIELAGPRSFNPLSRTGAATRLPPSDFLSGPKKKKRKAKKKAVKKAVKRVVKKRRPKKAAKKKAIKKATRKPRVKKKAARRRR